MPFTRPADNASGWGDEVRFAIDAANWVTGGLPSGDLSAYWRFDDASGTSVADATGNGLTGTWSGTLAGAQWGTGQVRGCGVFNGSDRIVTVNDANLLDLSTAFSIALWIKPNASPAAFSTPISKSGAYWLEGAGSGDGTWSWFLNNGADRTIGYFTLTASTWAHLVLTYDGTTAVAYKNGASAVSLAVTSPVTTNANNLIVGNREGFTRFYAGSLDEVGIWPRALSADDITSLYNGGVGTTYGIPAGRIGPGTLGHYNGNLGFFGKAPATQGSTPVTLADVIALLQRYGLAP